MKTKTKEHRLAVVIGACLMSLSLPAFAQGTFQLTSGSVGNINGSGNVDFSLTFNRIPDFFSVDQNGRLANAFQFFIAASTNVPIFGGPFASIIRGAEIPVANDIRIRNASPVDPDPNAGGWGSLRGSVPYALNGQTLTFSVPATVLNVQEPFPYGLLLTVYGGASAHYTGLSGGPIPIPEPSSDTLAIVGGIGMAWLGLRRLQRTAG